MLDKYVDNSSTLLIEANNLSKKFAYERIFKNVSFQADESSPIALTGHNGSGKSTLLQIIAGLIPPSSGQIAYHQSNKQIPDSNIYKLLSLATPYQALPEEFTLPELLKFHEQFKPFLIEKSEFIEKLAFPQSKFKAIKWYSSGMKQKLKLALALFSDVKVLLLDEPTANLDQSNIKWYLREIESCLYKKIIFVASNQEYEYEFCKQIIVLGQ